VKHIINETANRGEGMSIEDSPQADEGEPDERETPFARLRWLLSLSPNRKVWNQIVVLFERWHGEEEKEMAIAYAADHLRHWPDSLRMGHLRKLGHPCPSLVMGMVYRRGFHLPDCFKKDYEHVRFLKLQANIPPSEVSPTLFPKLTHMCIGPVLPVSHLRGTKTFPHIKVLDIKGCGSLRTLDGVAAFPALEELYIEQCTGLVDIKALRRCKQLRVVELVGCSSLVSTEVLEGLTSLQRVHVEDESLRS
jgi:hypothetical protein